MSKKKRRYSRRKRKHRTALNCSLDRHHICYQCRLWKLPTLRELREFWYSIILIPKNTLHREIHKQVTLVPPPKAINAKDALEQLRALERQGAIKESDSLEKRLMLFIALFDCIEPDTAEGFKKQLEVVCKFNKDPP